ncbi:MAG TPA: SDR family oxidoreductase [Polyangiales bacterium]|nr:SDR family oxidoreductase [Polyangiales bacterium]
MKNLFSVEGKVALVTGGSRGIGYMIARGYVENGVKTYISARKADACEAAAKELSQYGTCIALPGDVGKLDEIKRLAAEIGKRERALHILVNNAGANWGQALEEYDESGWDKVVDTNLKGVFFLTKELLPQLKAAATAADPARVINIGSIDGLHVPGLETYAYSSSKAGVHHLTRTMARRLAGDNITINAIAPGPFESKMMAETLKTFGDAIKAACPRGRIGEPEDMAGTAIFLASRAAAYITGAVLPVDGGLATTV